MDRKKRSSHYSSSDRTLSLIQSINGLSRISSRDSLKQLSRELQMEKIEWGSKNKIEAKEGRKKIKMLKMEAEHRKSSDAFELNKELKLQVGQVRTNHANHVERACLEIKQGRHKSQRSLTRNISCCSIFI